MNNQQLRPCPCCGSSARVLENPAYQKCVRFIIVKCDGCGMQTGNWVHREDAIAAWNRRQSDADEICRERAEYERLREKFERAEWT